MLNIRVEICSLFSQCTSGCKKRYPSLKMVNDLRFDGMSRNDRNWPSMFDQARSRTGGTASGEGPSIRKMRICTPSFLLKNALLHEKKPDIGNGVDPSGQKNCSEGSTRLPSTQYFRSILQVIYHKNLPSLCSSLVPNVPYL